MRFSHRGALKMLFWRKPKGAKMISVPRAKVIPANRMIPGDLSTNQMRVFRPLMRGGRLGLS